MTRLIVLDTNVVVSAGIHRDGAPGRILLDWVLEGVVQPVVCPAVLDEYRAVFARPKFRRYGFPPIWLDVVVQESLLLPDPPAWGSALPDPDDAVFLALAHTAGAALVTGNLAHYPSDRRHGVQALTPAEYLTMLQASR